MAVGCSDVCDLDVGGNTVLITLSVSISAMLSPAATSSPSFFFQDAMFPAWCVLLIICQMRPAFKINLQPTYLATPDPPDPR